MWKERTCFKKTFDCVWFSIAKQSTEQLVDIMRSASIRLIWQQTRINFFNGDKGIKGSADTKLFNEDFRNSHQKVKNLHVTTWISVTRQQHHMEYESGDSKSVCDLLHFTHVPPLSGTSSIGTYSCVSRQRVCVVVAISDGGIRPSAFAWTWTSGCGKSFHFWSLGIGRWRVFILHAVAVNIFGVHISRITPFAAHSQRFR